MKFEFPEINKVSFETENVALSTGGITVGDVMGSQAQI